ncbi:hypothetical protein Bca52824_028258 [Brassica carinata]|uniref:Uncharacterized protein n=1 Tax=Brassica carinata TaxID=52824 RepID=A0A8X7VBW9_BRACI|nr:hypothetical protein Bca52824_028258 [Brassica carinata]
MKNKHGACGALLNPSSAEPLVWPSPLKFISELNEEAKLILEQALMDANREREKTILTETAYSDTTSDDDNVHDRSQRLWSPNVCTVHTCTLLSQQTEPNDINRDSPPVCPFCRSVIERLVVAKNNTKDDKSRSQDEVGDVSSAKLRKHRRSINLGEESSSFMGISSIGSFRKITVHQHFYELMDKPIS